MTHEDALKPAVTFRSDADAGDGGVPGSIPVRSDTVHVYLTRLSGGRGVLQLLPGSEPKDYVPWDKQLWMPVIGHVRAGETPVQAALRAMQEQTGLAPDDPNFIAMWACVQVYPFFVPGMNCIMLSPRFVVHVARDWDPTLSKSYGDFVWMDGIDDQIYNNHPAHYSRIENEWPGLWATLKELLNCARDLEPGRSRFPLIAVDF